MDKTCLIYFVKAPVKGAVKTRLAHEVGFARARDIYMALAMHTYNAVKGGRYFMKIGYYPPEAGDAVSSWIGAGPAYFPQCGVDLGERMENAFRDVFANGANKALLIGSDIPGLGREVVDEAFAALDSQDAVINPTFDGGYCLIGFRADGFAPEFFKGIHWSTEEVFDQTIDILAHAGASVRVLPKLRDIDRPEDLQYLPDGLLGKRLSVIVPALHEAQGINAVIGHVRSLAVADTCEIIVVDGAPEKDTLDAICDEDVIKIASGRGRAKQMNAGAAIAAGGILLFLHADTRLPENALKLIEDTLDDSRYSAGAFGLMLDSDRPIIRLISLCGSLRSRITRIPYGDQAIFIKRDYFNRLGSYKDIALMEDIELVERAKRRGGKICILREKAVTSARKYLKDGPVYSVIRNNILRLLYRLGLKPETLAKIYYK